MQTIQNYKSTHNNTKQSIKARQYKTMQRLIKQYKQGFKALYILVFICLYSLLQYV